MTITGAVIPIDEPAYLWEFSDADAQRAQELQDRVGGWLEGVITDWGVAYVNEEGMIHDLPVNLVATKFLGHPQLIHGAVVVFGPAPDGVESSITEAGVGQRLASLGL